MGNGNLTGVLHENPHRSKRALGGYQLALDGEWPNTRQDVPAVLAIIDLGLLDQNLRE
ncbi:hypothetical protein D3C84_1205110 [compost metagenome]